MESQSAYTSLTFIQNCKRKYREERCVVMSHHESVGQNHSLLIATKSFGCMAK